MKKKPTVALKQSVQSSALRDAQTREFEHLLRVEELMRSEEYYNYARITGSRFFYK